MATLQRPHRLRRVAIYGDQVNLWLSDTIQTLHNLRRKFHFSARHVLLQVLR